jgi:prepilin-type N-terminal cleavage/methylation domain-containing protein
MNMILKKRLANRRGRKGFTLVEVIVVLVILAILAAIAIPALTGYIDKANWTSVKMQVRTQMTALQTMIMDQATRNGGFATHGEADFPDDYFSAVTEVLDADGGEILDADGNYAGYVLRGLSSIGSQEFHRLVASMDEADFGNTSKRFPRINIDSRGAIRVYRYLDYEYFDHATTGDILYVICVQDVNSTDPVTVAFMEWAKERNLALASGKPSIYRNNATKTPAFELLN